MKACAEMSLEEKVFERIHWDSRGRCAHAQHLKEGSLVRVGVTEEVHEADNSKDINVDSTYDINITSTGHNQQRKITLLNMTKVGHSFWVAAVAWKSGGRT